MDPLSDQINLCYLMDILMWLYFSGQLSIIDCVQEVLGPAPVNGSRRLACSTSILRSCQSVKDGPYKIMSTILELKPIEKLATPQHA